jgi:hypothetical protein
LLEGGLAPGSAINLKLKELHDMKFIKIALGLATIAGLMAVASAPALAGPVWKQCREHSGTGTKWEDSKCSKASSTGKWEWVELTTTEKATAEGTVRLVDTKVPIVGKVEIKCSGTGEGVIGPGKFGRAVAVTSMTCIPGENCEKLISEEVRHLPYQTEVFETEKTLRATATSGGSGAPGGVAVCRVLGVEKADECTSESGSALLENLPNGSVNGMTESKSGKANCTLGGTASGLAEGVGNTKSAEGWAVKVA